MFLIITELTCGMPPDIESASVQFEDLTPGSTAAYGCLEGYRQTSGGNVSVCGFDELWSTVNILCERMNWFSRFFFRKSAWHVWKWACLLQWSHVAHHRASHIQSTNMSLQPWGPCWCIHAQRARSPHQRTALLLSVTVMENGHSYKSTVLVIACNGTIFCENLFYCCL